MATIKTYTDIEQSKKLAEILPLESADMYYKTVLPQSPNLHKIPEIGNPIEDLEWYNKGYTLLSGKEPLTLEEYCIPCWSLAALLGVLPFIDFTTPQLIGTPKTLYVCKYNDDLRSRPYDNGVDATYEMIIKLHEQNLI